MSTVDLCKPINSSNHIFPKMKVLFNDLGYGTMSPYLSMPFLVTILNTVKLKDN